MEAGCTLVATRRLSIVRFVQTGRSTAAEWITQRGVNSTVAAEPSPLLRGETVRADELPSHNAPPKVLRLSFTPDGKLLDWSRNY